MLTAGVDIGSRNTKIVVWDADSRKIIHKNIALTGTDPKNQAENLLREATAGLNDSSAPIPYYATGYGRKLLPGSYISEISCHARGCREMLPQTRTIIDIGGQDSKVISLNEIGDVIEFAMNDKCAAGTGSFLEKVAELFKIPVADLGASALQSEQKIDISSTCVVFAESEIISLINRHVSKDDILLAVHYSVARKIRNLLSNITWQTPVCLTGGVALNKAIQRTLEDELAVSIEIPDEPLYTGALGAALFSTDNNK